MPKPMPSPRGTNHERAFLPDGGPIAAYDAALNGSAEIVQRLSDFLSDKITPDDLDTVIKMLGGDPDDMDGANMAGDRKRHREQAKSLMDRGLITSQEYARRIENGPERRTTEADRKRFAEMFPDAARLKVL